MDKDEEILSRVEQRFEEESSTPFGSTYDKDLERLSFTSRPLVPERIKTAWTEFLYQTLGQGTLWEWPINLGIAQWYEDKELSAQAVAVYEHLWRQIRYQNLFDEAPADFLLKLMDLYSAGFPNTQRAIFIYELIDDLHYDGYIAADDYAEAIALRAYIKKREQGAIFQKKREEAIECLSQEQGSLRGLIDPQTWEYLVRAETFSCFMDESIYEHVPVYFAKAVELEFNRKIFEPNCQHLKSFLESRRKMPVKKAMMGDIKEILVNMSSNVELSAILSKRCGGRALGSLGNIRKIDILKEHRNDNTHPAPQYTRSKLEKFLSQIRTDGWLFRFLRDLQVKEAR